MYEIFGRHSTQTLSCRDNFFWVQVDLNSFDVTHSHLTALLPESVRLLYPCLPSSRTAGEQATLAEQVCRWLKIILERCAFHIDGVFAGICLIRRRTLYYTASTAEPRCSCLRFLALVCKYEEPIQKSLVVLLFKKSQRLPGKVHVSTSWNMRIQINNRSTVRVW